jgi:hypothetical protein
MMSMLKVNECQQRAIVCNNKAGVSAERRERERQDGW